VAGLGIGIAWFGYWVLYYGVTQVQGGNWGFLDLGIPSRWAKAATIPKDGGGSTGAGAALQPTAANPLPGPLTQLGGGPGGQPGVGSNSSAGL
jgi:hypothetical protein